MIMVDTSAWIEYFRDGTPSVVDDVDFCLQRDLVGIGDLVYCEVVQGIKNARARKRVSGLFHSLPYCEMAGFKIAEKAAENYRQLRRKGLTIRKTIDVMIGTFCAKEGLQLIHHDMDFKTMAPHIGLTLHKR